MILVYTSQNAKLLEISSVAHVCLNLREEVFKTFVDSLNPDKPLAQSGCSL